VEMLPTRKRGRQGDRTFLSPASLGDLVGSSLAAGHLLARLLKLFGGLAMVLARQSKPTDY